MVSSPLPLLEGQKEEGPDHMDSLPLKLCSCQNGPQGLVSWCWESKVSAYFQEVPGRFLFLQRSLKGPLQLQGRLQSGYR